MPPIRNQGQLGSCTAFAWTGALQHLAMKEKLTSALIEPSELAFYWQERNLLGSIAEDSGASLSDGAKVSMQIGWLAESTWPYDIGRFTATPPSSPVLDTDLVCLSVSQSAIDLKTALLEGYGVPFGISVYQSFEQATNGHIPIPDHSRETLLGGHAIVLVGYDDANSVFMFRNSWGESWGDHGYGYIPYGYVLDSELASDFWTPRKVG
ncbi:MAG: C1 family peptidase [Patescibacteria group bacterium]|nr:C1 family peptidase [Patescibacteria group bacterium]